MTCLGIVQPPIDLTGDSPKGSSGVTAFTETAKPAKTLGFELPPTAKKSRDGLQQSTVNRARSGYGLHADDAWACS
jgi:hypothetical protein